jgi:hypothetical protein
MKKRELPWTKLGGGGVKTDGALSVLGKKTTSKGRIKREMDKQNLELYVGITCIIHRQSLCGKALKFKHVMKVVESAANRQFQSFLSEIEAGCESVLYHTELQWGSHG